ncbi:MAG: alpha/beta hydrolase fold domain-containing protein [Capsulimonadaceae bacterium]
MKSHLQALPSGAQMLIDIPYVTAGHERQVMDLYLPEADNDVKPLILWIHGGAFLFGSKEDELPLKYVHYGYALASINYRYSSQALFPAQLEDCKSAVRWLRANSDRYSLDPARFAAWGASAGAMLAVLLGVTGRESRFNSGENLEFSSAVQAVVDYFGPTDFLQMDAHLPEDSRGHEAPDSPESLLIGGPVRDNPAKAAAASPLTYVTSGAPPTMIVHGTADTVVPYHQSEILADALRKAGVTVTLHGVSGANHGRFTDVQVAEITREFLDKHLKRA